MRDHDDFAVFRRPFIERFAKYKYSEIERNALLQPWRYPHDRRPWLDDSSVVKGTMDIVKVCTWFVSYPTVFLMNQFEYKRRVGSYRAQIAAEKLLLNTYFSIGGLYRSIRENVELTVRTVYEGVEHKFVIEALADAFSINASTHSVEFVGEELTYSDVFAILKNNAYVQNIRIVQSSERPKAPVEYMPRDGDKFVVTSFLENLELYSKGLYVDSRYTADRHTGRAASFLTKLKEEKVETREQLEHAIEGQLDLWLIKGLNPYLARVNLDELDGDSPDFNSDKTPKKHAQTFYRKNYGNYFHLMADVNPSLKLHFFIKLYMAQMKGELKLKQVDVEAMRDYCLVPAQAKELDTALNIALRESKPMQEAAERMNQLVSAKMVPLLLAYLIAPTGVFDVKIQELKQQRWESLKHHGPYVILGFTAAIVLALHGGVLGFFVMAAGITTKKAVDMVEAFGEYIHLLEGLIQGSELVGHEHLPRLWSPIKKLLGVEADTKDQIEYFNAAVCGSMKNPADMVNFSRYLIDNLSKNLPLSHLHFVADSHHTHIEDIRTLVAFVLCISCLSLGYLPQRKHEIKTDTSFVNKLMFVTIYLGPSVTDMKNYLDENISKDKRPKLRRGLMRASYLDEKEEEVSIRWRWDSRMKVTVKPYKNKDPVTLSFNAEEKSTVEYDAMPFEIALLDSILNEENPGDSITLDALPGVSFSEAKVPHIFNERSASITGDAAALQELKTRAGKLTGIPDYKEYKTTQKRVEELEVESERHSVAIGQITGPGGRVALLEEHVAKYQDDRAQQARINETTLSNFEVLFDEVKKKNARVDKLDKRLSIVEAANASLRRENIALKAALKQEQKAELGREVVKSECSSSSSSKQPRKSGVMFSGFKSGFLLNMSKTKKAETDKDDGPEVQVTP